MIHEGVLCVNVFTHIDADVCVIFHLQKIVSRTVNKRHTFPYLRPRATTAPILPQRFFTSPWLCGVASN
jgi:hypothetical protein